jgi:hypothetical protein
MIISALEDEIAELKARDLKPLEREMVAASLDEYIPTLAERQQFSSYEEAKSLYERLTGEPWANEYGADADDEDLLSDDDDPDDPEQPRFHTGGIVRGVALDFGDIDAAKVQLFQKRFPTLFRHVYTHDMHVPKEEGFKWHFEWDKDAPPPDIKKDMLKMMEYITETPEFQQRMTHFISKEAYDRLRGHSFVKKHEDEAQDIDLDFMRNGHFQLSGKPLYQISLGFKDEQFQKNVGDLQDEMRLLGRKSGRTAEAQRRLYQMYFSREGRSATRIPNFRLDGPQRKKKARTRQLPKNTRDIVDTRERWRKDNRRRQRNSGR